ncbi:MAG: sigma-70 family RNA polymerase sigma factor [Oscillospiraceae bacterium]|nr:sigma-70 family RNA polymerase sigma factor [Oscillospiraceae bacterium]
MDETKCEVVRLKQEDYQAMTERELLLAAGSDDLAFSELISRHLGTVRRLAGIYSAGSAAGGYDYDDLCSEGLMGLMNAVRTYDEEKGASFGTYSYSCISNRMLNLIRRSKRIESSEESMENLEIADHGSPESILISSEETDELRRLADSRLSDLERSVFKCYLEGKSHSETAEELGINPKSVDNALQRIRRKFRS